MSIIWLRCCARWNCNRNVAYETRKLSNIIWTEVVLSPGRFRLSTAFVFFHVRQPHQTVDDGVDVLVAQPWPTRVPDANTCAIKTTRCLGAHPSQRAAWRYLRPRELPNGVAQRPENRKLGHEDGVSMDLQAVWDCDPTPTILCFLEANVFRLPVCHGTYLIACRLH